MGLPRFSADGLLPPGDHPLTIVELRQSFLLTGEGLNAPSWDSAWRRQLVDNLELFVRQLWHVGVERILIDGSFVTSKPHPEDLDGYFECEVAEYAPILVKLLQSEPPLPWDMVRRRIDRRTNLPKPLMWHEFRVEMFPYFTDHPVPTGVQDEHGGNLYFPALFRRDKTTGQPKGIIQIIRE